MAPHRFINKLTAKILVGCLLLFSLVGCSASSSQQVQITPNNSNNSSHFDQVTIQGLVTIASLTPGIYGSFCTNMILATNRLTYTNAELQQMRDFFNALSPVPPPNTLRAIIAGSTSTSDDSSSWKHYIPALSFCGTDWEITNIGQKPIQFTKVGLKLLVDVATDNTQYRLIDCAAISISCARGGGVSPLVYNFNFGVGKAGSVIQGQELSETEPTLNPGYTLELQFGFQAVNASASLRYTFEPEFIINTAETTGKVIDLSQWKETLVIAPAEHFSCYELRGNTFVSIASLPLPSMAPVNCV
jgi:hypothetical protein